jgi:hypothetical protein
MSSLTRPIRERASLDFLLVTTCPRCGKPTPARLASPREILCAACGYDGPPNEAEGKTIEAAREYVLAQNANARQLDEARVNALQRNSPALFAILFAAVSVPSAYMLAGRLHNLTGWRARGPGYATALGSLILFGISCGVGISGFLRIKRNQDRLRTAFAANPPVRDGEPASCRVCGGPLPVGGPVVRCTFCETDNYADLAVISKLAARQAHDAAEHERALEATIAFAQSVTTVEQKRTLYYTLLVPVIALWPLSVLTQILLRISWSADNRAYYATAMTRDGECIGRIIDDDEGHKRIFVSYSDDEHYSYDAEEREAVTASSFIGARVRAMGDGDVDKGGWDGMITAIYGSPLGNVAVVNDSSGDFPVRVDLRTLCLDRHDPTGLRNKTPLFAVDGPDLYWPDNGGIFRAPISGLNAGFAAVTTDAPPAVIAATHSQIFFAGRGHVFRADKIGGSAIALGTVAGSISLLDASSSSSDRAVVVTVAPTAAYVSDANSTSLSPIDLQLVSVHAIAMQGNEIFAAGTDNNGAPLVTRTHGNVAERWLNVECRAIAADDSSFYCADGSHIDAYDQATKTRRALFAFPPRAAMTAEDESIVAIAVDDTDVYFSYDRTSTRAKNGLVARVPKAGGAAHVIGDGLARVGTQLIVTRDAVLTTINPLTDNGNADDDLVLLPKTPPR